MTVRPNHWHCRLCGVCYFLACRCCSTHESCEHREALARWTALSDAKLRQIQARDARLAARMP